jgi:hypothetical protein
MARKWKRLIAGGVLAFFLTLFLVLYSGNFFSRGMSKSFYSNLEPVFNNLTIKDSSLSPDTIAVHANQLLALTILNDDNAMHKLFILRNAIPMKAENLEKCRNIADREMKYIKLNEIVLKPGETITPAFPYYSKGDSTSPDPMCLVISCPTCKGQTKTLLVTFTPQ